MAGETVLIYFIIENKFKIIIMQGYFPQNLFGLLSS